MRYVVTGGAGFIGSHYVTMALREGAEVTVLDKLTYAGDLANLAHVADLPGFRFVRGDIADDRLLADVVPGHDVVVNFAAESHVDRSIGDPQDFLVTNVVGTQRLLHAALTAGVRTFVQVSTDEVYGSIDTGAWQETDPLLPNSPYSASKAAGDLLCRAYHRTYGLDVRVTRCSNNYGPRQFPEKLIPLFVTRLLDGRKVPLYGDGRNVREWLHVEDHCRAIQTVLDKGVPGETYNVGGGTELTNADLVGRILDMLGAGWEMVEYVADRPGHDRRYAVDGARIRELGYRPRVCFEEGLAAVVRWYARNERWWRPLVAGERPEPAAPAGAAARSGSVCSSPDPGNDHAVDMAPSPRAHMPRQ